MNASATMSKLVDRAKAAANSVEAATAKGKAELTTQVDEARTKVQKSAADMKQDRGAATSAVESRWAELRDSWDRHVATARQDRHADRADHRADRAEDDAAWAVEFALAAIEDAEYAVLDSRLARMEADDAVAASAR